MVKSEILTLAIGQAGVQCSAEFWKHICFEEGIDLGSGTTLESDDQFVNHQPFFMECSNARWVPQTVFIDSEETVVDELICNGPLKHLCKSRGLTGTEDASNNFARGFMEISQQIRGQALIHIRRTVEQMYHLHRLQVFASISGGTGSGFCTSLMGAMRDIFPKTRFENHSIYPSDSVHDTIVEPYNSVLALTQGNQYFDCRFTYDNESLNTLIEPIYKKEGMRSTFKDLNYLISLVPSGLSACARFGGGDSQTSLGINLVPFPALKSVAAAIVPLFHRDCQMAVTEHSLLSEAFLNRVEMCSVDTFEGQYISTCLLYRGKMSIPAEYHSYIREKIDYVSWVPTGIKYDIAPVRLNHSPERSMFLTSEKNLLKVSNHTAITFQVTKNILERYKSLLNMRAYVHWFVAEGMEEGEFSDAQEKMENELVYARDVASGNVDEDDE